MHYHTEFFIAVLGIPPRTSRVLGNGASGLTTLPDTHADFHTHLCVICEKVPSSSREPDTIMESFFYQTSIQSFNKRLIFLYVSVCSVLGDQRSVSELLELGLQLVVSAKN